MCSNLTVLRSWAPEPETELMMHWTRRKFEVAMVTLFERPWLARGSYDTL